jgi:pimeloyl-ACP methyl ester carboxylesterase
MVEPFMAELVAAGYRVAAPWMRGDAPSVVSGPHDLDRLAGDAIELAQALSPGRRPALARIRSLDAPAVSVPVLHLHGSDDGCVAPEVAGGQERYFLGAFESEVIPEVGHFLHIEAKVQVAARITRWFRRFAISVQD